VDASRVLAGREVAVEAGERTLQLRVECADRRDQIADRREQAADQQAKAQEDRLSAALDLAERDAGLVARSSEANGRLVAAVLGAQSRTEAAEDVARQMAYLAEHDCLTNLPNRVQLKARMAEAIARALGAGTMFAVLYLDLDKFKGINDTLGHGVGDRLLQSTAIRLQSCLRNSAAIFRVGGDEFVILLPEVKEAQEAAQVAMELIAAMNQPHCIDGHKVLATLSVGISCYPDHGRQSDMLLRNADTAMYAAKAMGRNKCRVYRQDLDPK
jgi:diguanylate cyclase (GGDEF)-like protein